MTMPLFTVADFILSLLYMDIFTIVRLVHIIYSSINEKNVWYNELYVMCFSYIFFLQMNLAKKKFEEVTCQTIHISALIVG